MKDPSLDLLEQLPEVIIVEGQSADEQRVEDDPAGPDVGPPAVVLLPPDHLGTGVVRGAAARLQHGPRRLQRSHAKVRNLNVVLLVQEQVLWFQISVAYRVTMTEV